MSENAELQPDEFFCDLWQQGFDYLMQEEWREFFYLVERFRIRFMKYCESQKKMEGSENLQVNKDVVGDFFKKIHKKKGLTSDNINNIMSKINPASFNHYHSCATDLTGSPLDLANINLELADSAREEELEQKFKNFRFGMYFTNFLPAPNHEEKKRSLVPSSSNIEQEGDSPKSVRFNVHPLPPIYSSAITLETVKHAMYDFIKRETILTEVELTPPIVDEIVAELNRIIINLKRNFWLILLSYFSSRIRELTEEKINVLHDLQTKIRKEETALSVVDLLHQEAAAGVCSQPRLSLFGGVRRADTATSRKLRAVLKEQISSKALQTLKNTFT